MKIARYALAVLFLLMALGQAVSFGDFSQALDTYQVGVPTTVLALLVIAGELVGGAGLLATDPRWRRVGGTVSLVVAGFWAFMAVQAFARGLVVPNCGCFGRFLSQELRWWVLLEDAYLVGLAWWVWQGTHQQASASTPGRGSGASVDSAHQAGL